MREWGITQQRPAVARAWLQHDGQALVCIKGAPETIARLCKLDSASHDALLADVDRLAAGGDRVLAVATAVVSAPDVSNELDRFTFTPLGLLAFADPLRAEARATVQRARQAGISVVMITGDHPRTALTIAREAGIATDVPVASAADIDGADDDALRELVRTHRVFARVRHDQKLRLVEALKSNGEVVAMTGDGVNDAPALKAAHIGLAMGGRGTDVAREAASIVLLDDDLTDLIAGIGMGRRVFDNLRKAAIYIAAVHIPICGLALVPLLVGFPPLLMPLHVVLIEMLIDPMCALAFEREPVEPEIMRQPPRDRGDSLLGIPQLVVAGVLGALLLAASLLVYGVSLRQGLNVPIARTLAFIAFTGGNLMLIAAIASRDFAPKRLLARGRLAYWLIAGITLSLLAVAVLNPALGHSFQFEHPPILFALLAFAAGIGAVLAADRAKALPFVQHALGRTHLLKPEGSS